MGFHDPSWNISVSFGDPSCIGFLDIVRENSKTHRQMEVKTPTLATAWVIILSVTSNKINKNA